MKRLVIGFAFAICLAGAAVAGAGVVSKLFPIEQGEWAQLGNTNVYCQAIVVKQTGKPAFDCGSWNGNRRVAGTYSAIIDQFGVEIDHWGSGTRTYVHTYLNP
jgi:hypothetical protein